MEKHKPESHVVAHEHEMHESIEIDIFYPDHPPRKETSLFTKTKHHMVKVLDIPCFICGTKKDREVHHFHCEWADSDAADWSDQPWTQTIVDEEGNVLRTVEHKTGRMREAHPNFDWSTFKEPKDFIDSEYNMMILCAKHHRLKNHGIHLLPYPIWIAQKVKRSDFIFAPDEIKH